MATSLPRRSPTLPAAPETVLLSEERTVEIVVASDEVSVTRAAYAAGLNVADAHVHHDHVDAFYVLEGTLVFQIGDDASEIAVAAGGCVAVAPHVPHSFRVDSRVPARWLTIHAPDGGFASFMRGVRDGAAVDWDIHPVR